MSEPNREAELEDEVKLLMRELAQRRGDVWDRRLEEALAHARRTLRAGLGGAGSLTDGAPAAPPVQTAAQPNPEEADA